MTDAAGTDFVRHAIGIEAIVAGQGLGLCSDVLVARELRDGRLLRVSDIVLLGYGFHFVYRVGHPRRGALEVLLRWMQRQASREADCQAMRVREALVALFEFLSHVGPNFC